MAEENLPLKGSCGCGAIKFSITEMPDEMSACHCVTCQKLHSAPYAVFVRTLVKSIVFEPSSKLALKSTRYSQFASRSQCRHCGSQVYMEYLFQPHCISISAGLLDDPKGLPKLSERIFLKSAPSWDTTIPEDGVKRYEGNPPGFGEKVQDWLAQKKEGKETIW